MSMNSKQLPTVSHESEMSMNSRPRQLSTVSHESDMRMYSKPRQSLTASNERKMSMHSKQLPYELSNCKTLGDIQSSSTKQVLNEQNSNLLSKICNQKQTLTDSGLCDNWNNGNESSSCLNSKPNSQQQLNLNGPVTETSTSITSNSETSNVFSHINREEIVARRKLKVAALRKAKKQNKQQTTPSTPDFVLDSLTNHSDQNILVSEDFPDLSAALSNKKKFRNNKVESASEIENNKESKRNKGVEKSWKPKVKDPISIDIGQALQFKPEKVKVVTKKVDPTAQRNVVQGNILDSDNPQIKKGKVRPNKQRKATKLKKHILLERNERQMLNKQVENGECVNAQMTVENSDCVLLKRGNTLVREQHGGSMDVPVSDSSDEISSLLATCVSLDCDKESNSNNSSEDFIDQFKKLELSKSIHSKRFRDYCTNCLTEEVISSVCALLEKLAYFQDRTFARDPIRAQAKRRYIAGINQTKKYLIVKKVKLLVIAPDLEKSSGEGGLDNIVENFKNEADNQGVPYVFGPKRIRLAKAVFKKGLVSCVAVLSYDGAEELFSRVLEALNDAKMKYQALISSASNNDSKNDKEESPKPETVVDEYISADDVTSSLLAVLKGDLSPADKLLNAIHKNDWSNVET